MSETIRDVDARLNENSRMEECCRRTVTNGTVVQSAISLFTAVGYLLLLLSSGPSLAFHLHPLVLIFIGLHPSISLVFSSLAQVGKVHASLGKHVAISST